MTGRDHEVVDARYRADERDAIVGEGSEPDPHLGKRAVGDSRSDLQCGVQHMLDAARRDARVIYGSGLTGRTGNHAVRAEGEDVLVPEPPENGPAGRLLPWH